MSSSYDRSRSPVRRSDSDKYSRNDRGYDNRRDRRYDDYNNKSRRDRDVDNSRRRDYDRYDRRREEDNKKQTIPEEDIKMESRVEVKKRVPISVEELIQKKEQEKKETEKVSIL
jgi:ATP-dependent RNA helicase DDX23/PRP28